MARQIERKIIQWIVTFIFSFYLFQILEDFIVSQPEFIFKSLILLILPAPQDSFTELIQFLIYWVGFAYLEFRN